MSDLWDLTGQGEKDRARYRERIKEALKTRFSDVITSEDVITAPSGKTIRLRIEDIHEPRFRYDKERDQTASGVGSGDPEDGLIGKVEPVGGAGSGAGDGHSEGRLIDVTVPIDDVADWIFQELQLPRIQKRSGSESESEDTLTARGCQGVLLDKKRTLLQHALREKATARKQPWRDADFIYRRWQERREPSFRAVLVLVRDASASIDERMRFIIRTVCWWTVLWLRRNYMDVQVRFILHDTEGQEVTEEQFFEERAMGGTYVSSGLSLASELLRAFPAGEVNRYVCFFSDGDNWSSDQPRLQQVLHELLGSLELLAYGQVREGASAVLDLLKATPAVGALRYGEVASMAAIRPWLTRVFGTTSKGEKGA